MKREEKIQQYKKGKVFHADWIHTDYMEYFLNNYNNRDLNAKSISLLLLLLFNLYSL